MEENNKTKFWIGTGDMLVPAKIEEATFEIPETGEWHDAKGFEVSFDMSLDERQLRNVRMLFRTRIPRKKKKRIKKYIAKVYGIKQSVVRYNYAGGFKI